MNDKQRIKIQREAEFRDLPVPSYATPNSAGFDLHAAVRSEITLTPGQWRLVSTGIRVDIPEGFEGQVRPRSGLALKYGVTLLNSPGTVDSDYRGIVGVILINLGDESFKIHRGDRIAQMVIAPVCRMEFEEVSNLKQTSRGIGGFGSTGVSRKVSLPEKKSDTTEPLFDEEYGFENDITLPGGGDH